MQADSAKERMNRSTKKPYIRTIEIHGKAIEFVVREALFAKILDEEMLLDKVAIDFMLDEIASAIKNNPARNHPLPKTILLSSEKAEYFLSETGQSLAEFPSPNPDPMSVPASSPALNIAENAVTPVNIIEDMLTFPDATTPPKSNIELTKKDLPTTPVAALKETQETDEEESIKQATKADDYIKIYQPKYSFDDVYVDAVSKRRIVSALILAKQKKRLYEEWGLLSTLKNARPLVLNFYGPPGTGKSMMAEAIAHYLNKEVFLVNYSELESGTPGETPKNIVKCFKRAKENNAVLIFDEADSFLGKRLTSVTSAADYSINVTRSVMLIELEKFDGVVVFTTNFISNYDIAFKRRILASLEFKLPDEKGRAHIWSTHIPKQLPLSPGITPMALAYKYGGTTGADIKDIVLFAAVNCLERGRERLSWEDFDDAYQAVKNRYSVV